jgi:copper chaperone CopZ
MKRKHMITQWLATVLPALAIALGMGLLGTPADRARAAEWPADAYVLQVDGLACPYCGYGVEKQFAQQAGVEGTKINLEAGVVVVSVAAGTRFSKDQLTQIIRDAGFALGRIIHRPTQPE